MPDKVALVVDALKTGRDWTPVLFSPLLLIGKLVESLSITRGPDPNNSTLAKMSFQRYFTLSDYSRYLPPWMSFLGQLHSGVGVIAGRVSTRLYPKFELFWRSWEIDLQCLKLFG